MSTPINTSSFHSDLLPGLVKKWFAVKPADYEEMYSKILEVERSNNAYEIHGTITGFGTLVQKGQGAALQLDSSQEAFKPRYEHTTYALGFAITKEAVRDGHAFKDAKKFTEMLARSARITKEIIGANVINFAGTSGYTMLGGDAVVLASDAHPTRAGNQSNILAGGADLSEAALEAIRTQIENAKDNRGLKIKLMVKDLIINPAQRALAHRILKSDRRVAVADNDANFLKDTGTIKNIIVNPYLTSTTQWQVSTTAEDGLKFLIRQDAEMDTDNDFMTKNGLYSVDMRVSSGWDNFRGMYFSL
jgi:hypothetical protein